VSTKSAERIIIFIMAENLQRKLRQTAEV